MIKRLPASLYLIAASTCLITSSSMAQEEKQENKQGLLVLNSGDFLRGYVRSLDGNGILTWKHTLTDQEIQYNIDGIQQILFNRQYGSPETNDIVWLHSGDRFVCRVQSITDTEVVVFSEILDQELQFKRSEVAGVTLHDSSEGEDILAGGPMKESEWSVPGGRTDTSKVKFKNNNLIIEGSYWPSISREEDFTFPEAFIIDTQVDWKNSLTTRFEIGTANEDEDDANINLTLEIQDSRVDLKRVKTSDGARRRSYSTFANVSQVEKYLEGGRSMHLQCYINTTSGECTIFINGKQAGKSLEPLFGSSLNNNYKLGSGIKILQKSPSPVRIRHFAIKQWDGRNLPSDVKLRRNKSDHIYFEDGDNVKGEIIELTTRDNERVLTAKIPYSDKPIVSIPALFLDYFTFGKVNDTNTTNDSTIYAHLTNGSILHLSHLVSSEEAILNGELIGGYPIKIPSKALAELRFESNNPEDGDSDDEEKEDDDE